MYQVPQEKKSARTLRNALTRKEAEMIDIDSDQRKLDRKKGDLEIRKKQTQKQIRELKRDLNDLLDEEEKFEEKQFGIDSAKKEVKKKIEVLRAELSRLPENERL